MDTTNALKILNRRRKQNSFLIHTLENDSNAEFYFAGDSAAVLERNTGYWLFSLNSPGDFTDLFRKIDRDIGTIYVNGCGFCDEIRSVISDAEIHEYVQYVLESSEYKPDPGSVNPEVAVVPLDHSWVDFILSLYKSPEFGYPEYISACIDAHPGFGALINGERVGYVMIHMDGEIGSMVISEKARGKGIGRTLMQHITPEYAREGTIGCGFVLPENHCSQKMMVNSCFKALEDNVMWIYH